MTALAGVTAAAGADTSANRPSTLAVIGDTPYDDAQAAAFPALVTQVNADRDVRTVIHLGDIKGSQPFTDEFFTSRRALYGTFHDPFVFTPGDNEWTDCHRAQFGGYVPTERLASLRKVFYPHPRVAQGVGRSLPVLPQSSSRRYHEFVENVIWARSRVVFATVHVVGETSMEWLRLHVDPRRGHDLFTWKRQPLGS